MSIDLNLLSKIIETGSIIEAQRLGIKANHFVGSEREIWNFIESQYREKKSIPSIDLIKLKFGIDIPKVIEPVEVWVEELLERTLNEDINNLSMAVDKAMTNSKPSDAFEVIQKFVRSQLDKRSINNRVIPMGAMADELKQDYIDAEAGKKGIPTPWPTMDEWTMGWWPGDVSFFSARLGVGKTFCLLMIGIAARLEKRDVLFLSGEMSPRDIAKRYASIMAKLSYSSLRRGRLGVTLKEKYFEYLEEARSDLGFQIVDTSFGFTSNDVELAIDKSTAPLVLIDAAYLIQSSQKSRDRMENMAYVANDLKRFAKRYDKSICATTQLTRSSVGKKSLGDEDIALSDTVGWNSTNLFAMRQNDENRQRSVMELHPLKIREGDNKREPLLVNWDLRSMNFTEFREGETPTYGDPRKATAPGKDDDLPW